MKVPPVKIQYGISALLILVALYFRIRETNRWTVLLAMVAVAAQFGFLAWMARDHAKQATISSLMVMPFVKALLGLVLQLYVLRVVREYESVRRRPVNFFTTSGLIEVDQQEADSGAAAYYDDDFSNAEMPSWMVAASDPPVASGQPYEAHGEPAPDDAESTTPEDEPVIADVSSPSPDLLSLSGQLSPELMGGWIATPAGAVTIRLLGVPSEGVQLLIADANSTWLEVPQFDDSGTSTLSLPEGQWFVAVRRDDFQEGTAWLTVSTQQPEDMPQAA
jgi:hypothetical protein